MTSFEAVSRGYMESPFLVLWACLFIVYVVWLFSVIVIDLIKLFIKKRK